MVAHLIVAHHLIVNWQYLLTVTLRYVIVKWGIHTACTLLVCIIYYQSNNIWLLNGIFHSLFSLTERIKSAIVIALFTNKRA